MRQDRIPGLAEGRRERDEALDRLETAHEDWIMEAQALLFLVAKHRQYLTADDVAEQVARPKEPRAMGAVFRYGKSQGWIEPTNRFEPTARKQGHAGPRRVWRSLIWTP